MVLIRVGKGTREAVVLPYIPRVSQGTRDNYGMAIVLGKIVQYWGGP